MIHFKETRYGFEFGDAKVNRLFSDDKKEWITLSLETSKYNRNKNSEIQIYVTKTGKVRIHSSNSEWSAKELIKKEINNETQKRR